jgi:hypothetical protein
MCDVNSRDVFLLLFMALWVPTSATLFKRVVLTLWHAFLFLGLRFFPLFFFLLGGLHCVFPSRLFFNSSHYLRRMVQVVANFCEDYLHRYVLAGKMIMTNQ